MTMGFIKELLQKNQGAIDNELRNFESPIAYFQNHINRVIALGFDVLETDLESLFENPKAFITQKITAGENLQVGNLTLNKEKLFELLEKPSGTLELIDDIINDKQNKTIREQNIWKIKSFSILDNVVVIKNEVLERIENENSIYIESENQQNGYSKALELTSLLNELNAIVKPNHRINLDELDEILITRNGMYELKKNIVKRF